MQSNFLEIQMELEDYDYMTVCLMDYYYFFDSVIESLERTTLWARWILVFFIVYEVLFCESN